MAFSSIAKPGSNRGPCDFECAHRDCAELHAIASERCALCGDPIGFERNFCKRPEGIESPRPYVHFCCAEIWAENKFARRDEAPLVKPQPPSVKAGCMDV